jgi:pyridoxamine 5'-phosphate oxidase
MINRSGALTIGPDSQPLEIFKSWMAEAKQNSQIREATAMSLATASSSHLNARIVLCKDWSAEGFTFFTNYQSRKGLDLQHNPQAAAVFYWDPLFRQICISGTVAQTSRDISENYWNSRARESQLSQYISQQSKSVDSRASLEAAWTRAEAEFKGRPIPCPLHWGGYQLTPQRIEFWVGQAGRLHDRYEFEKANKSWTFRRLYP